MVASDAGQPQSIVAANSVAAPGAGSSVSTMTAPPVGWYELEILYTITGAVELLPNNVRLTVSGTTYRYPSGAGVAAVYRTVIKRIFFDGTDVTIKANAASTASTVYTVTMVATQIFP